VNAKDNIPSAADSVNERMRPTSRSPALLDVGNVEMVVAAMVVQTSACMMAVAAGFPLNYRLEAVRMVSREGKPWTGEGPHWGLGCSSRPTSTQVERIC
jgi:hypothetical protein